MAVQVLSQKAELVMTGSGVIENGVSISLGSTLLRSKPLGHCVVGHIIGGGLELLEKEF